MNRYQVLDATCGGRQGWITKTYPHALYMDIRVRPPGFVEQRPNFSVLPEVRGDFATMPFEDDRFNMVYYDPPHVIRKESNENSWVSQKYGTLLMENWKAVILDGLLDCWRVLCSGGCLIFKWSDVDEEGKQVIDMFPHKPLFGTRSGKDNNTIWYCFYKRKESDE